MLTQIARFELRYILRNPLMLVTTALTFALMFFSMAAGDFELGSEGGLWENAAYATLRNYLMISVIWMFATTSFVANAVIRDDETGFGPIVRSTRITKFEYIFGRFIGSFGAAALCVAVMAPAIWLGSALSWADPADIGPNQISHHLYGYFIIALPNILLHSAIFFALATITRSMMATYLGVIGLMFGFFYLQGSFTERPHLQTFASLADAFGSRALKNSVRFWTINERNVMLPDFAGMLLYNRLLWFGIAIAALLIAYFAFRFADEGMSKRARKKQKLVERASEEAVRVGTATALPSPQHGSAATRAVFWLRTKFEAKQVIYTATFPVLLAWGLHTTLFALLTQRDPDGRPTYATTLSMIPEIEDAFRVIPLIIAIYYAGELVWRERDRRTHELIDSSAMPNWGYVVPKFTAMALVLFASLMTTVIASVAVQLSLGYTNLELDKYLLLYVLPRTWDMLLLSAMAVFVQALSPHKTVGWGIMTVFLAWQEWNYFKRLINHNLLYFAGTPRAPLSDMNDVATFGQGPWTFRAYWGAFALLLLVVAHLLWRRGTEIRLMPRLAFARRRVAGAAGWVAAGALLLFAGTGAYAYYNTNVLNEYQTKQAAAERSVELERRFGKYLHIPQPMISGMTVDISLYPKERRAVTKGRYELRNESTAPISEVHVRLVDPDLEFVSSSIDGARLVLNDEKFDYRIYRLDRPLQPGETCVLTSSTRLWVRGFRNNWPNTKIIENGTFLNETELMPTIGMDYSGLILDAASRRKHGLQGEIKFPKLEDTAATWTPAGERGWAHVDVTISTDADQTPLAAGNKVSDVVRDGRRIARFTSNAPIHPRFAVLSARYAEKHRKHKGIDLAVYYHPAHAWNVDRMLDSMAEALDYFQANFGPYQFDHVRIIEFPGYRSFAQAFAGTIPYSEEVGFKSDFRDPNTIDYIAGMTAHELAHQWWAHQVIGAQVEGAAVFSETLAQYSADMVVKKTLGKDQLRRYLQYELDRYLDGRADAIKPEVPLSRVLGENHILYRKGALVMYLLSERLGEEGVNRALRTILNKYKFKGAPYPRTTDLIAALRAEADTPEEQQLITDLWERITLYDMKVVSPIAAKRADGKWDVTVPVEARKMYANGIGVEKEAPLNEHIEVGLFTDEPGRDVFDAKDVLLVERHPIRSGKQVLKFVTDKKPTFAGVDPYNFYIDRNGGDNVERVQ